MIGDRDRDWRRFEPPDGVERLDEERAAKLVPKRDPRGHKGTFGTLVAVCGSLDYAGAALLAGMAALRAGVGLLCLAVPASLQPLFAGRLIEAITMPLPETSPGEVDAEAAAALIAERAPDALLVGSGLRAGSATRDLVARLIAAEGSPAVLDAEALNSLAKTSDWWSAARRPAVLTPHPGEFARLDGTAVPDEDVSRAERARAAAARWGRTVILKGAHTVVAGPDGRAAMAGFENPALATGGTGDVLAGTVGSLLAQGCSPWDAGCLAVYLHGMAAEHLRERIGDSGLLASDLPFEIARVRRHLAGLGQRAGSDRRLGFVPRGTGG
jgi:NAD(P)H-hydrate epimerase